MNKPTGSATYEPITKAKSSPATKSKTPPTVSKGQTTIDKFVSTPQAYEVEYAEFMKKYKKGATDGERVGEVISRLAQYFSTKNISVSIKEAILAKKAAEIVNTFDDNTGKAISVSKADILIKATSEAEELYKEKAHLQNIEQFINALKYLQKGLLVEYQHMSGN